MAPPLLVEIKLHPAPDPMPHKTFSPGFRLSKLDGLILCSGLISMCLLIPRMWQAGLIIGCVVLHFFLFCNVFRITRAPELIWAAAFVLLTSLTILTGHPGWLATLIVSLALSTCLIWRATMRADYHGIYWQQWNPKLLEWWESQH